MLEAIKMHLRHRKQAASQESLGLIVLEHQDLLTECWLTFKVVAIVAWMIVKFLSAAVENLLCEKVQF